MDKLVTDTMQNQPITFITIATIVVIGVIVVGIGFILFYVGKNVNSQYQEQELQRKDNLDTVVKNAIGRIELANDMLKELRYDNNQIKCELTEQKQLNQEVLKSMNEINTNMKLNNQVLQQLLIKK